MKYDKLEEEQEWRTSFLGEIIDILHDEKSVDDLEKDELEDILEILCMG